MDILPLELWCEIIVNLKDPEDINRISRVNARLSTLVRSSIKTLTWKYRHNKEGIPANYVLKFPMIREVNMPILVSNDDEFIALAHLNLTKSSFILKHFSLFSDLDKVDDDIAKIVLWYKTKISNGQIKNKSFIFSGGQIEYLQIIDNGLIFNLHQDVKYSTLKPLMTIIDENEKLTRISGTTHLDVFRDYPRLNNIFYQGKNVYRYLSDTQIDTVELLPLNNELLPLNNEYDIVSTISQFMDDLVRLFIRSRFPIVIDKPVYIKVPILPEACDYLLAIFPKIKELALYLGDDIDTYELWTTLDKLFNRGIKVTLYSKSYIQLGFNVEYYIFES